MQLHIENFGPIKNGTIEIGNLTLIGGRNNAGKTYITYLMWGILNFIETEIQNRAYFDESYWDVKFRGLTDISLKQLDLAMLFDANPTFFENAHIEVPNFATLIDDAAKRIAKTGQYISVTRPFLLPAQRETIVLFQKALDQHNNALVKELKRTKSWDLLEMSTANLAEPIHKNIDFVRNSEGIQKYNSFVQQQFPEILTYLEEILGINYVLVDGRMMIIDQQTKAAMPPYMASTSARSLSGLYLWLKHLAKPNDLLMIDEPELNLHPESQIKMARLFVKLVNVGIKVWVTTHSDYIVKEINNMLMLSNNFENHENIMTELGYTHNEILKTNDLHAYIVQNGTIERIKTDHLGMLKSTFDTAMEQINECTDRLYNAIEQK
jgi:predicted ATP-dependent endonuclease of OLD family